MNCALTKTKVLRLRLKDKHAKLLNDLAREVNFVWNYCNELQITMFNRERRFLSGYDFAKFTRGATKLEELFGDDASATKKRGPAPKLLQQIERMPRTQQRFVMQMLDTVIAQASR